MEQSNTKKFYESKTIIFAVIQVVVGILLAIADYLTEGGALTALGLITAILRWQTKVPITK